MPHEPGTTLKQLVKLPRDPGACWEWLGRCNDSGVPTKQFRGRPMAARRWLWGQLFGEVPPGLEVFGTCGTLTCVNPYHMRCGTNTDRIQLGSLTDLTPADVREIKKAKSASLPVRRALAARLGVDLSVLRAIWRGDTWRRVTTLKGN